MVFGRAPQRTLIPQLATGDRAAIVLGRREKPALPERIRRDIERQQEAGEYHALVYRSAGAAERRELSDWCSLTEKEPD